jgi:putative ABC transport system permease protein
MGLMGGLVDNSRKDLCQIWVVDKITQNANELGRLDERFVREIRSIEGVENTFGVVAASGLVKFANGKIAPVLLIGSEPPLFVAGPTPSTINAGELKDLVKDGAVSAEFFDESVFDNSVNLGQRIEINGKEAFIRLQTKNARGFAGSFFYTTLSKARFFGNFPENKISAIAVQVRQGDDIAKVVDRINATIYGAKAWNAEELQRTTIKYITISSNIGTSIGSLVVFAFISGFFIIGLTLYSSALDRIKDYGTLKAMGATNGYVRRLILVQSFLFAIIGFVFALLLLFGFSKGVASAGLVVKFTAIELLGLFLVTFIISVGGSLFAIRKINSVEPASVFRG